MIVRRTDRDETIILLSNNESSLPFYRAAIESIMNDGNFGDAFKGNLKGFGDKAEETAKEVAHKADEMFTEMGDKLRDLFKPKN